MIRRKTRLAQWLLLTIFITLSFCASILYQKSYESIQKISSGYNLSVVVSTTPQNTLVSSAPFKYVTKSLSELGKMDDLNRHVLFLNHIPNCGGEVLIYLLQKMQGFNNFRHVRLKSPQNHQISGIHEEEFVFDLFAQLREAAVPLSFDKQVYFINFTAYDKQSPTFINIIRDPEDKFISRRKNAGYDYISQCFDNSTCYRSKIKETDLTIPYFCGNHPKCTKINNNWALEMAKANVEKYYPVVGILEEINITLEVMEKKIPYFFKGVQNLYKQQAIEKFHRKKTIKIKSDIKEDLRNVLVTEYEFYEWIKIRLLQQLQVLYTEHFPH